MPKKQSRKCSICRKSGHTKKTCKAGLVKIIKNKQINKKVLKKNKKTTVFVQFGEQVKESPHVVNLRDNKREDLWKSLPVYVESNKNIKILKKEIDLSKGVKQANQKKEIEKEVLAINKKVKEMQKINKEEARELKDVKKTKIHFNKKIKIPQVFGFFKFNFFNLKVAYALAVILLAIGSSFPIFGYYQKIKAVGEVVVEESTDAFLALQASTVAALSSNLDLAEQELTHALQSFSTANSIIEKDYQILMSVAKLIPVVGTQVESRQNLLAAGSHLALGNTYLVKGIGEAQKSTESPFTDRLNILQHHLQSAILQYSEALNYLNRVDQKSIPTEYQNAFGEFKILFGVFIDDMKDLASLSNSINTIFGDDSFKRYLVVFQNNHELRPTGGFMGSFAVVDVKKGKILNIEVPGGGTYDLRGQLTEFVKPPLPLQLLNKRWEFQDANWFPNFSASAQKMEWFYEKSRGATVDGVIAVNASVLERVLKVLGPVEANELVLNREDVLEKLQYEVEVGYDKEEEQPKEILAGVLDNLMLSLENLKSADAVALLTELHGALSEKELQVYMNDEKVQNNLRQFGWTGEVLPVSGSQDYLGVFHTNIQGQKSDAKIEQIINHEAIVDSNGSIVDTVVIKRIHTGLPGEQFYGGPNISYVRVYAPAGAELLSAGGFQFPPEEAFRVPEDWYEEDNDLQKFEKEEGVHLGTGTRITREFGKTVFGNWVITNPGETSEIYFRYKLPFQAPMSELPETNIAKWQSVFTPAENKQFSRYSLFVQKQSGTESNFYSTIIYPEGWLPVWRSNNDLDLALNGARFNSVLETDKVIGIVVEREIFEP